MQRNGAKFFPLIIIIVIIALVIAAVVSIGRAVFNGPDDSTQAPTALDKDRAALLDTSSGHAVRMTIRGPIVAEENFTSYNVTVSNSERAMKVYKGYLEEETNSKTLSNNTQAYEQFVYALDKANMMKGSAEPDDKADEDLRGICARGYVYEYALLSGGNVTKELWTSTCEGSKGNLNASKEQLTQLFLAQIPGSNELIPFRQSSSLRL